MGTVSIQPSKDIMRSLFIIQCLVFIVVAVHYAKQATGNNQGANHELSEESKGEYEGVKTKEQNIKNRKIKRKSMLTKAKIIRRDQQKKTKFKRKQTGNNLKAKQIRKINRRIKKQKRKQVKKL